MIRLDMHIHTSYSHDSQILIDELLENCDLKGIDCVAVTDHDTLLGALELHRQAPSRIIVGEEIHTTSGEITGLFLKENIEPLLSPMETVKRIKEQGGLIYLPHPFDNKRKAVLDKRTIEEIWKEVDIVEVFNSRNIFPWSNSRALHFAEKKRIVLGAGSDAHSQYELGLSYVMMEPFNSAADFLSKLATAEIRARRTPMTFRLMNRIRRTIRGVG